MSDKLRGLSDRDRAVVATVRMRLSETEAIAYLTGEGYEMDKRTWYRIKAKVKKNMLYRLYYIAKIGFVEQHSTRIDTCELLEKLMWENYHLEKSPYRKVQILKEIGELQPIISSYYDTTRAVLEKNPPPEDKNDNRLQQESNKLSSNTN